MDTETRRAILRAYRRERESTNANPVGESTGRTYIPIPAALQEAGAHAESVAGFVRLFEMMLQHSPVVVRRGELIVGDYYYLLPYEIIPMNPPLDYDTYAQRGALPVPPSGHTVVNLERGLAMGWRSIAQHIQQCRTRYAEGSAEANYLEGAARVVELIQAHIRAYAAEAARVADSMRDAGEAAELRELAQRCARLSNEPPQTFHEALQWYFFYVTFERATSSGMGSVRIDQVFYPYYLQDVQAGVMDNQQTQLLLECLLLKEPLFCSIGGVTPAGADASNELSHLALAAYDAIGGPSNLALRWHTKLNTRLMERAVDILSRHGTGVPSMVNDDVIIPSLTHFGFPLEQARDYCFAGCFWYCVPGKEYTYHDLAGVSGVRALKRALHDVIALGPTTYDVLWRVYQQYLNDAVNALLDAYAIIDPWLAQHYPEMVVSLLMDGCLERGRDVNAGGAEVNMMTVLFVGLANVADSLYALKLRVFEEKLATLAQVQAALDADFVGHEWLQKLLHSAPKYGNGASAVDEIAVQVAEHFKTTLSKYRNGNGCALRPAFYSWHRHTFEGSQVGATPDGRKAGLPLAHGGNPAHGAAKEGITAAVQSMTRIRYDDTAGCPLHIHLHDDDTQSRSNTINALVHGCFQLGAPHVILNVVDGRILREAIEQPQHYSDLTIRITGYSARFVHLERKYQEEIAARNVY